jgi:hypothetical protein
MTREILIRVAQTVIFFTGIGVGLGVILAFYLLGKKKD